MIGLLEALSSSTEAFDEQKLACITSLAERVASYAPVRRLRSELMDANTSLHSSTSGHRKQRATTSQFGGELRLLPSSVTSCIWFQTTISYCS
jgi:hypothetical protein